MQHQHMVVQWNLYSRTLRIQDSMGTTSLQRTLFEAPNIDSPMLFIHFHLWRVDNLSTVDILAGSNASFTKRSHIRTYVHIQYRCLHTHVCISTCGQIT